MPSIFHGSKISSGSRIAIFALSIAVVASLSSCGSLTKQELKLVTDPADASVLTHKGKSIGRTPMVIDSSNREEFDVGNGLAFIIAKDGYRQREVHLTNYDIFEYSVSLSKLNDDDFAQVLASDFGSQTNELSQRILEAHGAVIANDLARAENLLNSLIEKYKKIGPLYTLKALVAIKKNDYPAAEGLLRQALILNKSDQTANTVLARIQGKVAPAKSDGPKEGHGPSDDSTAAMADPAAGTAPNAVAPKLSAKPDAGSPDAEQTTPSASAPVEPAQSPAPDRAAVPSAAAPVRQLPKKLPAKK